MLKDYLPTLKFRSPLCDDIVTGTSNKVVEGTLLA